MLAHTEREQKKQQEERLIVTMRPEGSGMKHDYYFTNDFEVSDKEWARVIVDGHCVLRRMTIAALLFNSVHPNKGPVPLTAASFSAPFRNKALPCGCGNSCVRPIAAPEGIG